MDCADTTKLKQALIDAFMLDAEEAIESCPAPIAVSEAHQKRMQEILSSEPRRRISYRKVGKRVIALLVAALLIFLTGCAMFYQKIVDFIITAFDKFARVEQSVSAEEFPQTIEDVRVPTVMLDGYELVEEEINSFIVRLEWVNEAEEKIIFVQAASNIMYFDVDNEKGNYSEINIDATLVFKHAYENRYTYAWKSEYTFNLMSSRELSENELWIILNSIE